MKTVDMDAFGKQIGQFLGMTVELRESLYRGEYVNCMGPAADSMTIETHEEGDGTPKDEYEDYREYPFILHAENHKGKRVDIELRHKNLKGMLNSLPELTLLEEKIAEY
ncbi:MAG: hypothetical protein EOO37_05260 [Cytophagaceae bacterium]|nr:MAG: hypothetical protein EOO37_05260 [Cytophagaceae bacterium]